MQIKKTLLSFIFLFSNALLAQSDLSLHSHFTHSKNSLMVKNQDKECVQGLKEFYESGERFFSPSIKAHTQTRKQSQEPFYHYTNAKEVRAIAQTDRVEDFFEHIRSNALFTWNAMMYVADDPYSSKKYGTYQVQVFMKDGFNVLEENRYGKYGLAILVHSELKAKYPSLSTCEDVTLYHLAAEDMGIDVIHYSWNEGAGHWYQVLRPQSIDHLKLGP